MATDNAIQNYIDTVYNTGHLNPMKQKLTDNGYLRFIIREGVLVDDELWVHPDTLKAYMHNTPNTRYIFLFKEKYLNSWSSTQTMHRYKKFCKYQVEALKKLGELTW